MRAAPRVLEKEQHREDYGRDDQHLLPVRLSSYGAQDQESYQGSPRDRSLSSSHYPRPPSASSLQELGA